MFTHSFTAKFNSTVPGTLPTSTNEMTTATTRSSLKTTTLQSSLPTTTMSSNEESMVEILKTNKLIFEAGSPLFYGVIAAGSAVIIVLLLCLVGVSIFLCRRGCKCD